MSLVALEAQKFKQRWGESSSATSLGDARALGWASNEKAAWKPMHDVVLALKEAAHHESISSIDVAAAKAVAGFFDGILEDLTRAVPWDNERESAGSQLKEARQQAVSVAWDTLVALADASVGNGFNLDFFGKLGTKMADYDRLIEALNQKDREQLLTMRREANLHG